MPAASKPEIADFLRYLGAERNDSPHTVKAYGRDLAAFAAFLDGFYGGPAWSWAGVDRLAIRGFLGEGARRGWSKRSTARALSAVRTFYRFLGVHHGLEVNPARAASMPRLEKRLPGYLDRKAVEALFALAEARAGDRSLQGLPAAVHRWWQHRQRRVRGLVDQSPEPFLVVGGRAGTNHLRRGGLQGAFEVEGLRLR